MYKRISVKFAGQTVLFIVCETSPFVMGDSAIETVRVSFQQVPS